MEVILLENIKNLGKIGDVVSVKRGYGRNFLLKYDKALKATDENKKIVNKKLEEYKIIPVNLCAIDKIEVICGL